MSWMDKRNLSPLYLLIILIIFLGTAHTTISIPSPGAANGGAFTVTTIYTNIPGHQSADVPGYSGVHFGPGTGTAHFDRVFGSPKGNWILSADTDLATTNDEVLIVNDKVKIFEGDSAPWTVGEHVGLIEQKLGINDSGAWVFATNTDGPTTSDEYLVSVSSSNVYTITAQEGDSVPLIPGATWGSTLETPFIALDGSVGFSGDLLGGVPTTQDDILVLGNSLLAREGVTIPAGQLGTEFWENFDLSDAWISADGSSWLAQGDLTGDTSTDDIVVVDGSVVVQEGVILAGTSFINPVDASGIVGVHMAPNGDWFVRGNNDTTEQDWIYSNGGLLTATGEPIYVGATENFSDTEFSDTFFLHIGDSNGNYVIGGVTDGASATNGVLVANNQAIIAREGDQLDLDNSGSPDDAYFDTFGNDDGFLDDNGNFYVVATIKDGTDTTIGQGFFKIDISPLFDYRIYMPIITK